MFPSVDTPQHLRKWMEELPPGQFRHLFDHLPGTLFFAKDREGRLVAGNPAFVKRCGYQREDQIVGLSTFTPQFFRLVCL